MHSVSSVFHFFPLLSHDSGAEQTHFWQLKVWSSNEWSYSMAVKGGKKSDVGRPFAAARGPQMFKKRCNKTGE